MELQKHIEKEYEVYNGLVFEKGTDEKVKQIICNSLNNGSRIRLFYGDPKDGVDWCETYDTIGYIGATSMSALGGRFPLLMRNNRSTGGDAIMCDKILKITIDKKTIYVHPKYTCDIEIKEINDGKFKYAVTDKKEGMVWNVETLKGAESVRDFFLGKRNNYTTK